MRLHFIVNEFAGNGKSKKLWVRLEKQLEIPYELHKTQYAQHAIQLAQQLAEQTVVTGEKICLIGIGGDGTIHEIIRGERRKIETIIIIPHVTDKLSPLH